MRPRRGQSVPRALSLTRVDLAKSGIASPQEPSYPGASGQGLRPRGGVPPFPRPRQAITSQLYDNVTLWRRCRIDGEPSVAIVLVDHVGEGKIAIMPLFVGIIGKMEAGLLSLSLASE
jgi:hypothetical protein